jgi:O-antigen/teichoic acid export membrane protein
MEVTNSSREGSAPSAETLFPVTITENAEFVASKCTGVRVAVGGERFETVLPASKAEPTAKDNSKGSYGQILKSSALVGGSQALNLGIGIIRTKAMALLLGPSGFGLFGLYGSIADLTQNIAGLGVNSSGVRQIAEAAGSGDEERMARTAAILRRTSLVLGIFGAVLLALFAKPVAKLTFGNAERTAAVSLLSLAVLLRLVSAGQGALIQGMRRIADLAKMNVFSALFGTCISIPLVYVLREKGVVPSLIVVAAMMIATSWWYSRKIQIQVPKVRLSEVRHEVGALLKLGSAFMASGLMTMGVAYLVRIIIARKIGFDATGLYQSAWTLGGLYVGFILQAMGADFYPRLTASISNNPECNRLVNEQALIGLLLAGPGVIATLTFAPLVVMLFYSAKFGAAVPILRWICLGVTLQVVTWPMGFIIVAKGKSALFFVAELAWTIVAVTLAWSCVSAFRLNGAGIAFFLSYVFHGILIYPIVHRLSRFKWSTENYKTALLFFSLIAMVFVGCLSLKIVWATCLGTLALVISGTYSIRTLLSLTAIGPRIREKLQGARRVFNLA